MATSFSAQIKGWNANFERYVEEVVKSAAEDVAEEMTRPGPSIASTRMAIAKGGLGAKGRGKGRMAIQGPVRPSSGGGRLPIDTGFLRASFLTSTTAMPRIDSSKIPEEGKTYPFEEAEISLVVQGWDMARPLYLGFTAAYAAAMEFGANGSQPYAFVGLAVQKWPQFVQERVSEAKAKYGL